VGLVLVVGVDSAPFGVCLGPFDGDVGCGLEDVG
jgi:hypothetical protein